MGHPQDGIKRGAWLAALLEASEPMDLDAWWRARMSGEPTVTADQAELARSLLQHVARTLEGDGPWDKLEIAHACFDVDVATTEPGGGHLAGDDAPLSSTDIPPAPDTEDDALSATMPGDALEMLAKLRPEPPGPPSEPTAVSAHRGPVSEIVNEETMISPVDMSRAHVAEATMMSTPIVAPHASAKAKASPGDGATRQVSYDSDAHGFALTVEEYAAFCAERDATPDRIKALRARYAIADERGHAAVDRYFEQLFGRDPSTRTLWQSHYQRYAGALRQRG
jgi:hypothetical protein